MHYLILCLGLLGQAMPALAAWDYVKTKGMEQVEVSLTALHPTQAVVGFDQIYYKLGRYAQEPLKLLDDYCELNGQGQVQSAEPGASVLRPESFSCEAAGGTYPGEMKTAVVGPKGQLYLTDGHHSLLSLWEAPTAGAQTKVWLRITDNFSDSEDPAHFWQRMAKAGKVWLYDDQGAAIDPEDLPQSLGLTHFLNDQYRALVYFTRKVAYAKPYQAALPPEFLEFYWGQWLRGKIDLADYDLAHRGDYRKLVLAAAKAIVSLDENAVVSPSGWRKADLGGYTKVDHKELAKVVKHKIPEFMRYKSAITQ